MHIMLWVLFIYTLIAISLLIVFFVIIRRQREEREKSHSNHQLHNNEQISSETDGEDAFAQNNRGAEDAVVAGDIDSIEESTDEY